MKNEQFINLDEQGKRSALLNEDESVIIQTLDGITIDLSDEQAMHLCNAILARSRVTDEYDLRAQTALEIPSDDTPDQLEQSMYHWEERKAIERDLPEIPF